MKASELTEEVLLSFIKQDIEDMELDPGLLLSAAKSFVMGYTGLNEQELDRHEDLTIAILILCSDMYDNRQYAATRELVNPAVDKILNLHRRYMIDGVGLAGGRL